MEAVSEKIPLSNERRVRGLDSLRLVLAMWVVLGHVGAFPLNFDESNWLGKFASGVYGNAFSGPAAVIVFFVISGFCIHYPFRNGKQLAIVPYFARRHIRIWIPIFVAVLLAKLAGVAFMNFQDTILWSLLAEELYYLIYPALLKLRSHFEGWREILVVSYLLAIIVIFQNPTAGNYPSYGPYLNWILGLPCWILGCILAECVGTSSSQITSLGVWLWRGSAWGLSVICSVLRFHSPIGYPWSLTMFAIFAYFWVNAEVQFYKRNRPNTILENAGKASYSIYIMHMVAVAILLMLAPNLSNWSLRIAFILGICAFFYLTVEYPSHKLARSIAARLSSAESKTSLIN